MVGSGGWRWIKAAPTLLPLFDPSEKRRTSLSQGGRGKTKSGLKSALVGSGDELSGRGRPTRLRVGKVCSDHGLRSEANLSMWRGGRPQDRVEFHSLVIGYGTAWRPVKGSRGMIRRVVVVVSFLFVLGTKGRMQPVVMAPKNLSTKHYRLKINKK